MKAKTMGQPIGMNGCQSVGHDNYGRYWYTTESNQYSATMWLGHHRNEQPDHVTNVVVRAGRERNKPYLLCGARPNVAGPRQARCHVFPDTIPADGNPPVLLDVETPGQGIEPPRTVDHTEKPVTRQSDRPYLIWWLMMQQPSKDMIDELQPHDRDDIKQDLAIKYWRQSVKQEANGKRITNPAYYIAKEVSAWIGRNTATAQSGPLTQQQRDDAVDSLDAQRKASEESRLAKLEAELKIEQGRFAAALAAKQDAKQPKSLFCFKW